MEDNVIVHLCINPKKLIAKNRKQVILFTIKDKLLTWLDINHWSHVPWAEAMLYTFNVLEKKKILLLGKPLVLH